ncbi:MAG: hypothetical protein ACRDQA_24080 [Nocardioidaceae bacterium]
MSESRQQRRARERVERKATTRPGPDIRPVAVEQHMTEPTRKERVLEVALTRDVDPDDPEQVAWAAEWGLQDDDVGIEDTNEDLQELVDAITEDARSQWADRYDLTIEWTLDGDRPAQGSIAEAVAQSGIILPTTFAGQRLHGTSRCDDG